MRGKLEVNSTRTTAMPAKFDLRAAVADLPPRLREILRLIALGCSIEDIANILGLAPSTVDNHRTRLMNALGVYKSTLLVRIALKYKVSHIDEKLTAGEKRKRGGGKDGWN